MTHPLPIRVAYTLHFGCYCSFSTFGQHVNSSTTMSLKLRVQVSAGTTVRQAEVDRAKPDYNNLKSEVQKKTKQQGTL
jgi:hypothetical protein